MGEEEQATLDGQFFAFAKLFEAKRDGTTITLYRSDYWMRQAKLLDDRKLTMTDTGILFNKFRVDGLMMAVAEYCSNNTKFHSAEIRSVKAENKTEITWDEWLEFLTELCELKNMDEEFVKETLTNCGLPGQSPVVVPQYRDYFVTYKPKEKLLF